jgi:hypothetical protein
VAVVRSVIRASKLIVCDVVVITYIYRVHRHDLSGSILNTHTMEFLQLVGEVGFPIAGAIAAGYFVFLTIKFILAGVTGGVNGLKNIIHALDNRVQTMNNDVVQIDAKVSTIMGVKPNVERIAANEGKEDARRD